MARAGLMDIRAEILCLLVFTKSSQERQIKGMFRIADSACLLFVRPEWHVTIFRIFLYVCGFCFLLMYFACGACTSLQSMGKIKSQTCSRLNRK